MGAMPASMRSARALHHLVQVGAAEADVTQQTVVKLHKVGIGTALFRTAEKRREHVHFATSWFEGHRLGGDRWRGLCPRPDEPLMNGLAAMTNGELTAKTMS